MKIKLKEDERKKQNKSRENTVTMKDKKTVKEIKDNKINITNTNMKKYKYKKNKSNKKMTSHKSKSIKIGFKKSFKVS